MKDLSEAARPLFDSLVERHSQLIYLIALAVTRSPQDAEDVVQETFLRLYQAGKWEQIEDAQAYLARIAWRLAAKRKKPHEGVHLAEPELLPELAPARPVRKPRPSTRSWSAGCTTASTGCRKSCANRWPWLR